MIEPRDLYEAFQAQGVDFFTGVPDSLLKEFCACIAQTLPAERHVIAANEGGALALAVGRHLGNGGIPLVYLQNSGFGNLVNPLLSLADPRVYAIPVVLMIGWRGEPGIPDEPQHVVQGGLQEALHGAVALPYRVLRHDDDCGTVARWAVTAALERSGPVALLVRKGIFRRFSTHGGNHNDLLPAREEAIDVVLGAMAPRDVVVATTGMASREVYELRERRGETHERDFLTVGSMGHASQIALGVAGACRDRRVWCLDGDGSALMHLGGLAIAGTSRLRNFVHVLLNNGAHDSVGGQPTVGQVIDLPAVAKACGYAMAERAKDLDQFRTMVSNDPIRGPAMFEIWVRKGARENLGRPLATPVENKQALRAFIGFKS